MMRLRAGVASDRGLIRPANEDSFFVRRGLYAVCDGMGGARAGEVASQMACMGLLGLDPDTAGKKELRTAVVNTNQAIVSRSLAEDHLLGMGTTLTAVMIKDGRLTLAHVGDSRAYLFREGALTQLSDDHSWVGEMVRRGELTAEQAAVHPHRSVITRALGTDREVDPDMQELLLSEGDRILLCSDGLTGMVADERISALLAQGALPQAAAESLVKAALAGGGEDNVTVVIVDVLGESDQEVDDAASDQVGDGILVGPTDRGQLAGSGSHRGRRAGAAVRERLSRRAAPVLRPVGARQSGEQDAALTRAALDGQVETTAGDDTASTQDPTVAAEAGAPAMAPPATAPFEAAPPGITALMPQVPPLPEPPVARSPARKRNRRRWFFSVVAVLIVIAAALGGFAAYNSSVYYVGTYDDGSVALFRGLPGDFLGVELSSVVELATVDYDVLATYMQGRVDAHELVSKEEGRAFLKALDEQQ